jgi:AcrR family transcriptional regulator
MTAQAPLINGMEDSPRGKLLSAAARLFRQNGFDRTTVRDIAREVGIQSGSLFHHFHSKEDILFAVMEEVIRFNTRRLSELMAAQSTAEGRLLALIRGELQSIVGDTSEAMVVLVQEWRCLSPERQEEALALREIYEQLWLDVLTELHGEGAFRADPFIMRRLLNGMTSWTANWFHHEGSVDMEELARIMLERVIGERRS